MSSPQVERLCVILCRLEDPARRRNDVITV